MRAEFLFDFGSPNAYFAHRVLPGIEKRTGVRFEYEPVLLGGIFKLTNNRPPMVAFGGVKNKPDYEMLEIRRFIARHKLAQFKMNPHFPVNTLATMRMAVAAKRDNILPAYVETVFRAMWEDGKKMDDAGVIRATLAEAGLPADALLEAAQTPEIKQALMNATEEAVNRGAFGIPTFFVNGEIFFGKDRLRDVEEEILTRKSAS
jgi:2-hydroxychromene-2-carboxylate isomerase